jgi:hypothetical protein
MVGGGRVICAPVALLLIHRGAADPCTAVIGRWRHEMLGPLQ